MAPEVLGRVRKQSRSTVDSHTPMRYPFKIDSHGFGMLCYEILTGKAPFSIIQLGSLRRMILEGLPETSTLFPKHLAKMVRGVGIPIQIQKPALLEICVEFQWCTSRLIQGMRSYPYKMMK